MWWQRRVLAVAGVFALVIGLISCSGVPQQPSPSTTPPKPSHSYSISDDGTAAGTMLARVYKHALVLAGAEVKVVRTKPERLRQLVTSVSKGEISLAPVAGAQLLAALDPKASARSNSAILAALERRLPEHVNALPLTDIRAGVTYVVGQAFAEPRGLTDLKGLRGVGSQGALLAPSWLRTHADGPPGLLASYRVQMKEFRVVEAPAERLRKLLAGDGVVAAFRAIDPEVMAEGVRALTDPEGMLLPDPMLAIADSALERDARSMVLLDSVQQALSNAQLQQLMRAAQSDDADQVVAQWFRMKGLTV